MKHYIDIESLRECDVDLGGGMIRKTNRLGFEVGDHVVIQEKFDGANASIEWDNENNCITSFSRRQPLTPDNNLNGFYQYANTLNPKMFEGDNQKYTVFGEWAGARNKILYDKDKMQVWYVFDIYNNDTKSYMPQAFVKEWCDKWNLTYIHTFYDGQFISWDHVRSFAHSPQYGQIQEGVICKNQDKLQDKENRFPVVLKCVNKEFAESMIKAPKVVDPEKEAAKAKAQELIDSIVTENRVQKMILKLRDEGVIPSKLTPKDMGIVAKNLPKRIYDDCMKEEKEVMLACGEFCGKMCNAVTMKHARNIILGK